VNPDRPPSAAADPPAEPPPAPHKVPVSTTPSTTDQPPAADAADGSFGVLIVDDSSLTRSMVRRSVELGSASLGLAPRIAEAADGVEALERLRTGAFDVCFLDLNMPRLGGVEVARAVCEDAAIATRVVIVSSEAMSGRIDQLREVGVAGYIRKPFQPEAIRQMLAKLHADHAKLAA